MVPFDRDIFAMTVSINVLSVVLILMLIVWLFSIVDVFAGMYVDIIGCS